MNPSLSHLESGIVQHELLLLLKVLVHGFRQQEPHDGVISADGRKKERYVFVTHNGSPYT